MRYLTLPALVVAALLLSVGQEMAATAYAYVTGVCRDYLAHRSAGDLAISIMGALTLTGVVAGVSALAKDLHRLRSLSRTLATSDHSQSVTVGPTSPVAVLVQDGTPFAFCHGLRNPRIYVSSALTQLLTPTELRAVLLHEEVHARRRDPARVLAARVLAVAGFPLPAVRQARDRYLARLEVQADRETVAQVGAQPLAAALLKLLSPTSTERLGAAVAAFNVTEERVRRLTEFESGETSIPLAPRRAFAATGVLVIGMGLTMSLSLGAVSAFLANAAFCPIQVA